MADLKIKTRAAIESGKATPSDLGQAFRQIEEAINNMGEQASMAPVGDIGTPKPHTAISVLGGGGYADVQMTLNPNRYRGEENFVEYSNDGFKTFGKVHVGASDHHRIPVGSGNFQFRSYSQHGTSAPSAPIYSGMIDTTGSDMPPIQGSQQPALSGYGTARYTSTLAPKRGNAQ